MRRGFSNKELNLGKSKLYHLLSNYCLCIENVKIYKQSHIADAACQFANSIIGKPNKIQNSWYGRRAWRGFSREQESSNRSFDSSCSKNYAPLVVNSEVKQRSPKPKIKLDTISKDVNMPNLTLKDKWKVSPNLLKTTIAHESRVMHNKQLLLQKQQKSSSPRNFEAGPVHGSIFTSFPKNKDVDYRDFEEIKKDFKKLQIDKNAPIKINSQIRPRIEHQSYVEKAQYKSKMSQQQKATQQNTYQGKKYCTPQRKGKVNNFSSKASNMSRRTREDR